MTISDTPEAPRWRSLATALCVLLGAWSVASVSEAQGPPELTLTWQAPADCPDAQALQRAVQERLGRAPRPQVPEVEALAVVGVVEPQGQGKGLRLRLTTRGARGPTRREFSDADCAALADAAALVVALALDPSPPEAREAAAAGALGAPAHSTERSVGYGFAAGALLDVGSLSRPAVGPGASLSLYFRRLRAEIGGFWLPDARATAPGAAAEVGLFALSAAGCVRAAGHRVSLWPCAGVEVGRLSAAGLSPLVDREQDHRPWVALRLSARAAYRALPWLSLAASAGAAFVFTRPRFQAGAGEEEILLHRPGAVAGRFALEAELRF